MQMKVLKNLKLVVHKYNKTTILYFSSIQLYNIVIDVEAYPLFLPWCLSSKIISKKNDSNFDALLTVGYKAIDENYTSRIEASFPSNIKSCAISGPFKSLDSNWSFSNINKNSCKVEFKIEYEFKSFFLDKIMGGLFKKATLKMLEAFEKRAYDLYK